MYKNYISIILPLLLLLLLVNTLSAQTTTIFSGTSGTEDSWLDRNNTTTNYGGADTLMLQNAFTQFSPAVIRAISINDTIPTEANVIACSLQIYVEDITGTKQIELGRVCKDWIESQITHSEWKTSFGWGTDPILSAGSNCTSCDNSGDDTGDDYAGDITTSASFSSTGYITISIDTCHANAWVSGDDVNSGIRIWDNAFGSNFNTLTLTSSEDATNPPKMIFIWEIVGGVPNARHSADGISIRHSADGQSSRHPQ